MKTALWTVLLATFFVTACGTTPPSRLYTLGADASEGDRIAMEHRRIEITSVRIPELWDRPQMVLAKSASEVDMSEFNRWAAPLKTEIPRVVVRNLVRILGDQAIWLREDFPGTMSDLRAQVTIERIEAVAGENLYLDAAWVIRGPSEKDATYLGHTAITEPLAGDGYDSVVAATRRALLSMSIRLAKDIAAMPKKEADKQLPAR